MKVLFYHVKKKKKTYLHIFRKSLQIYSIIRMIKGL